MKAKEDVGLGLGNLCLIKNRLRCARPFSVSHHSEVPNDCKNPNKTPSLRKDMEHLGSERMASPSPSAEAISRHRKDKRLIWKS